VSLDVEFPGTSKNSIGVTIAGLSVRGTVNRKDFGVSFHAVLETGGVAVSDKVKLELDLQIAQVEAAASVASASVA